MFNVLRKKTPGNQGSVNNGRDDKMTDEEVGGQE